MAQIAYESLSLIWALAGSLRGNDTLLNRVGEGNSVKITLEPRYLELAYFELPLISKRKSGPCFNMKLWQQVTI